MVYDEHLVERVRDILLEKAINFDEKKMFGGFCFMLDDKMCIGISKDELMVRIDPDEYDTLLKKSHAKEMKFTGRAMKGFIFIEPLGIDMSDDLEFWVDKAIEFNPKAKSSKKKKFKI